MGAYIDDTATVVNVKASDTAGIYKSVYLKDCILDQRVKIGDFTRAEDTHFFDDVSIQRNGLIYSSEIGRRTYTGKNFTMWHAKVGAFTSISWNVSIGGANHDYSRITTHAFLYTPNMGLMGDHDIGYDRFSDVCEIGNDVWIGADAIICRDVRIGDGAVIGAGAVVTHDVAPYTIVAGAPARYIKQRFDDETIEQLLNIRWWEFDDQTIRDNFLLFNEKPVPKVLDKLWEIRRDLK